MEQRIHILTGCTAVGKTELALQWAERTGAEIISCDSLLFYRGMDIGTAKPSRAELARVPHHLIDICNVTESMNVARFIELARAAMTGIWNRGHAVLVTGGSGFYLKAFLAPVADEVDVPPAVRSEVRKSVEGDLAAALEQLRALNPDGLGGLDVANPRRVARALERCRASGRTLREMREDFERQPGPFANHPIELVELVRAPDDLERRIAQRVDDMLAKGLVDEVRVLLERGLKENSSAARAIGYRETIDVVEGAAPSNALREAIIRNTRALVKKQRTWFRTQLPAHRRVDAAAATASDLFAGSARGRPAPGL